MRRHFKPSLFVALFWILVAVVSACGGQDDSSDQKIADEGKGVGEDTGAPKSTNQLKGAPVRSTPIPMSTCNDLGCDSKTTPLPSPRALVTPKDPIRADCTATLTLSTGVGPNGPFSQLKGKINSDCLNLTSSAELLIKTDASVPFLRPLACASAKGSFPVVCQVRNVSTYIIEGKVIVDILPDPNLVYSISAQLNMVK